MTAVPKTYNIGIGISNGVCIIFDTIGTIGAIDASAVSLIVGGNVVCGHVADVDISASGCCSVAVAVAAIFNVRFLKFIVVIGPIVVVVADCIFVLFGRIFDDVDELLMNC
ncbi:hypothetical protein DERP_003893 [Dermatophagoides pteronyssinus]|uniref:Transmembrane protein n=1 Tax=Dermatophagoides pteronyssinus TaxID=6956 RepID=A0ABQ8J7K1_DERPT|nr:hypothetical protein DERP_003893 [Dermatophagoides pteronyssinus]